MSFKSGILRRVPAVTAVALAALLGAGTALADDPIKTRQGLMKTVGFSAKAAGAMVKGEEPYDPVRAELAVRAINAAATALPNFFPEDSKTGGETQASPKIWEDMKGFLHQAHELQEHSEKAIEAAKKGLEDFKKEFAAMTKYCKSCHEGYRIKKN